MRNLLPIVSLSALSCALLFHLRAQVLGKPQPLPAVRREIQEQLTKGKGLVIVMDEQQSSKGDDETYGDWANNLNQFATAKPSDLKLIVVTPLRYRQIVSDPKPKRPNATLFIRDAGHVLCHDGPIMEQSVYKLGLAYIRSGLPNDDSSAKSVARSHLTETAIRLVL